MTKILACLTNFYSNVYIYKPLTSRGTSAEKYIVCLNFKKPSSKVIEKMESIVDNMNKNKNKNLVDIFSDYVIDNNLKNILKNANIQMSNKQFININETVTFINKQNYRGYEYDNKRQEQIMASEYWIENFLQSNKDFVGKKKEMEMLCDKVVNSNKSNN
jgi:hypothetical protein